MFRFASLQSAIGKDLLMKYKVSNQVDAVVLIKNNKVYIKSNAALEIIKQLNGLWFLFYGFKIIPFFIRDGVYDLVAKYRYKWFGKQVCEIEPKTEFKHKFL